MPKLCGYSWDSLTIFLHETLDRRDVFPGGIIVPQTFGGMGNWNPHVHTLSLMPAGTEMGMLNRSQGIVSQSIEKFKATRLVIAHRLSKIRHADRICVHEGGSIAESGTYDELMTRKTVFYKLAQRQLI